MLTWSSARRLAVIIIIAVVVVIIITIAITIAIHSSQQQVDFFTAKPLLSLCKSCTESSLGPSLTILCLTSYVSDRNASSTLVASFAEVSTYGMPSSSANSLASEPRTWRL